MSGPGKIGGNNPGAVGSPRAAVSPPKNGTDWFAAFDNGGQNETQEAAIREVYKNPTKVRCESNAADRILFQTSATKIQRKWRSHHQLKKIICGHMKTLSSKITSSVTASFINNGFKVTHETERIHKEIDQTYEILSDPGLILQAILIIRSAPCKELAQMLYLVLMQDHNLPNKFRENLQVTHISNNDHALLQSGDIIIDLWIEYLDTVRSSAPGTHKTMGFIGSPENYVKFFNSHKWNGYRHTDITSENLLRFDEANTELEAKSSQERLRVVVETILN